MTSAFAWPGRFSGPSACVLFPGSVPARVGTVEDFLRLSGCRLWVQVRPPSAHHRRRVIQRIPPGAPSSAHSWSLPRGSSPTSGALPAEAQKDPLLRRARHVDMSPQTDAPQLVRGPVGVPCAARSHAWLRPAGSAVTRQASPRAPRMTRRPRAAPAHPAGDAC
jgi:hypothetical protein